MKNQKKKKKIWLWGLYLLLSPVLLFFVAAVLFYLPPVQRYVVDKVVEHLEENTGMHVTVDNVRLAFPLDLAVNNLQAEERGNMKVDIRVLRLSVSFWPLFKGIVDVDGFELQNANVNTGDWISDVSVRGNIGRLTASTHGINLKQEDMHLDDLALSNACLYVALSDTAIVEENSKPANWNIAVPKVKLVQSRVLLSLPGDSMRVDFGAKKLLLDEGNFDLGRGRYAVSALNMLGGSVTYISRPWWNDGREGNRAYFASDSAAWSGFLPHNDGFDPNYVKISQFRLALKDFCYEDSVGLAAELAYLGLEERCGLTVDRLSGQLNLQGDSLSVAHLDFRTPTSSFKMEANMSLDSLFVHPIPNHQLKIKGKLSRQDLQTLAKGYVEQNLLDALPDKDLEICVKTAGNLNTLQVDTLEVLWKNVLKMKGHGEFMHLATERQVGHFDWDLRTFNASLFQRYLRLFGYADYVIPNMSLTGKLQFNGNNVLLALKNSVSGGLLSIKGKANLMTENYQAELQAKDYPLQNFMPNLGLKDLTTSLNVGGHGFNPLLTTATNDLELTLDSLNLNDWQLGKIRLLSHLSEGKANINFGGNNDLMEGEGILNLSLGDTVQLRLRSEIPSVELAKLMDLEQVLTLGTSFALDVETNKELTRFKVLSNLKNIRFITEEMGIPVRDITINFGTSEERTSLLLNSGDMNLKGISEGSLENLFAELELLGKEIAQQISERDLSQKQLKEVAPHIDLQMTAGKQNPLFNLCREMGYNYESLALTLGISPSRGVTGNCNISEFSNGGLLLDTVVLHLSQDTAGLVADGWVKNFKKRNKTKFEANIKSYLFDRGAGAELKISNQDGVVGMDFGMLADLNDEGIKVHLYPEKPVIAFRKFSVNPNNYLKIGKDSLIHSDIDLLAEDGTSLHIYTMPKDSSNDLTVSLNQLDLGVLSQGLPYLPALQGMLNCDLHIVGKGDSFSALALMDTKDLVFEGAPFGDVGVEANYMPESGNRHYANIYVNTQGNEVLTIEGAYSTEADREGFDGSVTLADFPLQLINGFLVGTDVSMSGTADGNLDIKGKIIEPQLNGKILFKDTHLVSEVYGLDFKLDDKPVYIDKNQLILSDYCLKSKQNNNPLHFDGIMDMSNLSDIWLDINMSARNFELINTKKKESSLLFGKVYADFDGLIKGNFQDLSVRGKLSILDRTDMTYVLKDSPLTVEDRLHDLVQFIDFEEIGVVEEQPVIPVGNFNMTMAINISNAALFHCNLSDDGSNYIDLEGGGDLTLRLTKQGDMRLTGRFTANSGEMKYSLPVIPLKTFKLVQGSYVDFTGDVANPTLNITAKERVKAVVTENDQPRSVAFDVGVSITQPLDRMGLEFIIEAPEDLTMQNKLASMTKAERGKAAVGMLVTGLFITDESVNSSGSGFKASNALTAFLQSEIQNIAGSALKTIDVSIGMENNTTATGNTTTDYSFQFSKRFWGNRIAVIIGGKVSTGAEAENSAESFIDNIAIEYRLDKTASRYVKVFYERSFQDALEGQLTKTGAGLVLRRKSDRLGDLFIFRNRKK